MLAVAFLNPFLLGGLGLVAVPIVIHLLSRRRFRRIEWGATTFLLQAEKQNRRRVQFEQWLLVALRCLALALLALLVARPFVQPGWIASLLGGGGGVQRIIVLDDSASMGYRSGAAATFDDARASLDRLLTWLAREAAGDSLWLYRTSTPEAEPIRLASLGDSGALEELRATAAKWKPAATPARPRRMLERVATEIAALGRAARSDVYILSDFQRSDWLGDDNARAAAFEPIRAFESDTVRAIVIQIAPESRDNLAIVDVALERPLAIAGQPAVLKATVANYARELQRDIKVQPEIDGHPLPVAMIDSIAPGASATATFEVAIAEEGHRELVLRLAGGDGFVADDVRRISVELRPAINVLIVSGDASPDPLKDETRLLQSALSPPGQFSSGIRVEVIDADAFESVELKSFDAVVLCNTPPPSEATADTLRRYVSSGGGLMLALGSQTGDGIEFSRVLFGDGSGVLPAALEMGPARSAKPEGVGITKTIDHPLTAIFPRDGGVLSETVRFRAFFRSVDAASLDAAASQPGAASQTAAVPVVLARYNDESKTPAIIERTVGRGRVVLLTSTIDLDWNDWARAADGSYVVTMLEAVQHIARKPLPQLSFVADEPLTLPVYPEDYDLAARVKSPAFPDDPATDARVGDTPANVSDPVKLIGPRAALLGTYTFELSRRGGGSETRPVCVNLAAAESDLRSARQADIGLALVGVQHEYVTAADSFLSATGETRRELWPMMLYLIVAALMGEQYLAWYFGRPAAATTMAHTRILGIGRIAQKE
ncbi:MAG: BatA domain-containing protein [Phycisphaerae bacterium]